MAWPWSFSLALRALELEFCHIVFELGALKFIALGTLKFITLGTLKSIALGAVEAMMTLPAIGRITLNLWMCNDIYNNLLRPVRLTI